MSQQKLDSFQKLINKWQDDTYALNANANNQKFDFLNHP